MRTISTIAVAIIGFHLLACSKSGQIDISRKNSIGERYKMALSYMRKSNSMASYRGMMSLDTTTSAIFDVSGHIIDPDILPFEFEIVKLKYGLTDKSVDRAMFLARLHEETMLNRERIKSHKPYERNELQELGTRKGASLLVSFSDAYPNIIPERDVVLAEVRPIYSTDQSEYLREHGIATHMYLKFMFVFKASAIDTVFSGIIT